MRKEEFLKKLDYIIQVEEEAIPIYVKHLDTVLNWSGLGDKDLKKVHSLLYKLAEDSKNHKKLFTEIKELVSSGGENVY